MECRAQKAGVVGMQSGEGSRAKSQGLQESRERPGSEQGSRREARSAWRGSEQGSKTKDGRMRGQQG